MKSPTSKISSVDSGWSSLEKSPNSPKINKISPYGNLDINCISQQKTNNNNHHNKSLSIFNGTYYNLEQKQNYIDNIQEILQTPVVYPENNFCDFTSLKSPNSCLDRTIDDLYGNFVPEPAPSSNVNTEVTEMSTTNYEFIPAIYSFAGHQKSPNLVTTTAISINYPDLIDNNRDTMPVETTDGPFLFQSSPNTCNNTLSYRNEIPNMELNLMNKNSPNFW